MLTPFSPQGVGATTPPPASPTQDGRFRGGIYPDNIRGFIQELGASDFVDAFQKFHRIVRGNPRIIERFLTHNVDAMTPQQRQAYRAWLSYRGEATPSPTVPLPTQISPSLGLGRMEPFSAPDISFGVGDEQSFNDFKNQRWGILDYWTAIKHYGQYLNPIGLVFRELPRFLTNVLDGYTSAWEKFDANPATRTLWANMPFWKQMAIGFYEGVNNYWKEDREILDYNRWLTRQPIGRKLEAWGSQLQSLFYEPITFFSSVVGGIVNPYIYGDDISVGDSILQSFRKAYGVGRSPFLKPEGVQQIGEVIEAQHGEGTFFDLQRIRYRDRSGRETEELVPTNRLERYKELQRVGEIQIQDISSDIRDAGLTFNIGGFKFNALYTPFETLEFFGNPINWAYRPAKLGVQVSRGGLRGVNEALRLFNNANLYGKLELLATSPIITTVATATAPFMTAGKAVGLVGKTKLGAEAVEVLSRLGATAPIQKATAVLGGLAKTMDNISANLFPHHYIPDEYFAEGVNAQRVLKWWDYMDNAVKKGEVQIGKADDVVRFMEQRQLDFQRLVSDIHLVQQTPDAGVVRSIADRLETLFKFTDRAGEAETLSAAIRKSGQIGASELTRIQNLVGDFLGGTPEIVANVFATRTRLGIGKNWAKGWVRANAFIQRMSSSRVGRFLFPAYRFADPRNIMGENFSRLLKNAIMGRANELRELVGTMALAFSGANDFKNTPLYRVYNIIETHQNQALRRLGLRADRGADFVNEAEKVFQRVGYVPPLLKETPQPTAPFSTRGGGAHVADFLKDFSVAVKRVEAGDEASIVASDLHSLYPSFNMDEMTKVLGSSQFRQKWLYLTDGSLPASAVDAEDYWTALSQLRRWGLTRKQVSELVKHWETMSEAVGSAPEKVKRELGNLMLSIANNQLYRTDEITASVNRITAGMPDDIRDLVETAVMDYLNIRHQAKLSFDDYVRRQLQLEAVQELNHELNRRYNIAAEALGRLYPDAVAETTRRGCL